MDEVSRHPAQGREEIRFFEQMYVLVVAVLNNRAECFANASTNATSS